MRKNTCSVCNSKKLIDYLIVKDSLIKSNKEYNLIKCKNCGLIFVNPQPKNISDLYPEEQYGFYSNTSKKTNSKLNLLKPTWRLFIRLIFGKNPWMIHPTGNSSVLDIGCATGLYLKNMKDLGWNTLGIEPSKKAARMAKNNSIKVINTSFENAKISKKFDLITIQYVIEHFTDPKKALIKAHALLKENGTLILSTPNTDSIEYKIFKDNWGAFEVPRHLFLFNKKNIQMLLKKTGFREIKVVNEIYPASALIGINNITKKKFSKIINSKVFFWLFAVVYSIFARIIGTGRLIVISRK